MKHKPPFSFVESVEALDSLRYLIVALTKGEIILNREIIINILRLTKYEGIRRAAASALSKAQDEDGLELILTHIENPKLQAKNEVYALIYSLTQFNYAIPVHRVFPCLINGNDLVLFNIFDLVEKQIGFLNDDQKIHSVNILTEISKKRLRINNRKYLNSCLALILGENPYE